jgi:chitinase
VGLTLSELFDRLLHLLAFLHALSLSWEFPNDLGVGCNIRNSNDTANFLAFLRQLRNTTVGSNLTISAAVGVKPWLDTNGPSENVSDFKDVLDFITIMNYDIRSNSSFGAGPSSPLDDSCAPIRARNGSAKSAVSAWSAAGFPINQIVLGVPSYGHSYSILPGGSGQNTSTTLPMYPSYANVHVRGDKWDGFGNETDVCGVR